ncbi:MAG: hypothetical protein K2N31_07835 [Treponemataceae bacterium]|nr:hypothetical protein [Treponemataceae bacterium]
MPNDFRLWFKYTKKTGRKQILPPRMCNGENATAHASFALLAMLGKQGEALRPPPFIFFKNSI